MAVGAEEADSGRGDQKPFGGNLSDRLDLVDEARRNDDGVAGAEFAMVVAGVDGDRAGEGDEGLLTVVMVVRADAARDLALANDADLGGTGGGGGHGSGRVALGAGR